jgi:hypothetical protein
MQLLQALAALAELRGFAYVSRALTSIEWHQAQSWPSAFRRYAAQAATVVPQDTPDGDLRSAASNVYDSSRLASTSSSASAKMDIAQGSMTCTRGTSSCETIEGTATLPPSPNQQQQSIQQRVRKRRRLDLASIPMFNAAAGGKGCGAGSGASGTLTQTGPYAASPNLKHARSGALAPASEGGTLNPEGHGGGRQNAAASYGVSGTSPMENGNTLDWRELLERAKQHFGITSASGAITGHDMLTDKFQ